MSKKKIIFITLGLLTLVALLLTTIPALAANSGAITDPAKITPINKAKVLVRLLLVQDESKVDAFIARAEEAGKLTDEQGARVKEFWTAYHKQFLRNAILRRLLTAHDETRVYSFLENAVTVGKIDQTQAEKITQIWEILHSPVPGQ